MERTHTYVARAWYRDTATLFNLASFLALVLQESKIVNVIPERYHPAVVAIVTVLNIWIRFQSSTRPVSLSEGSTREVHSIDPRPAAGSHRPPIVPLLLLALLTLPGCASIGAHRHAAAVTVVSAHAVLSAVQDTERALVCGTAAAPAPPACVTSDLHRTISAQLVTAFDLDGRVARLVRDVPPGGVLPSDVPALLGQIAALVDRVLEALPTSTQKTRLTQTIGGTK